MTNMNGRVIIIDFETGLTKRTIATGCPGIVDIKVLNLQSSEYLVWLSKNGSLGISEVEERTDQLLISVQLISYICNTQGSCGSSESLESDWRNEVKPFTQLMHSKELPSALMAMGPPGKCPKVFFIRLDPIEKVMTVVSDWQDFQWVFWNNLPTWVNLKTNQRRMDWRQVHKFSSIHGCR